VASPAFGKTVVAGHIIATAREKSDATAWFLVHRKNLLRQTSKSFWSAHIEHGLITSGKSRSKLPVQVGTIGTVYSRRDTLAPPNILFVDEAHLAKGNMFETVIRWCLNHGCIVIGLTGTPERLDGKALGDIFEVMVEARSTHWLIGQGRLSSYEMYSTSMQPDLSGVKKSGGDYNREQLAEVMDNRVLVGDAIAHWRKYANNKRTVVYCVNVKHSKHTAETFNAAGIPAVHVDADTTETELKEACEGLASGRYLVLCNCELVIEGFDLGSQIGRDITLECCILLRPTQSLARYLQMVFRALRRKDYPAVILDHAGCAMRHGLPDDDREWSLEGRKKKKRKAGNDEPDVNVQQCKHCFFIFRPGPDKCPSCGKPVEKKTPAELRQIDGELVKIDAEAIRRERKRDQGKARGLRELIELGVRRGMKNPSGWAVNVHAARQGRKPSRVDYQQAKQMLAEVRA
jgi:superfamily II DNA or RNA helicase